MHSRGIVRSSLALSLPVVAALTLSPASRGAQDAAPTPPSAGAFPAELDAFVTSALAECEVPGALLAVVRDGQVVVARGYGVRALGGAEAVDADTLFDIASLTKSFTAAMIATLVDEKKLSLDTPVREYLPSLRMKDPYVAANLTLRDLLSHRSGIRNNAAPFRGHLTRDGVVDLFSRLDASQPFRTRWVYSNVGYAVAGQVAAAVTGESWEELVTRRILEPLGMKRTTADYEAVPAMGDYALGHLKLDGTLRAVPRGSERLSTAAAGAVHSSARDLATWLAFQLGDGTVGGRRLISADLMEEMHAPQVFVPTTREFRASRQLEHWAAYGFGWQIWDYRGHSLVWHSGNGDGQAAYMVLLPEDRLGIAFAINSWQVPEPFYLDVVARITDYYLGLPTRDYLTELRNAKQASEREEAEEEARLQASRLPGSEPSLPLAAFAGRYRDGLGLDVEIELASGTLSFRYADGQPATLEHWHDDLFRLHWQNPFSQWGANFVRFEIDQRGRVAGLSTQIMRDDIEARRLTEAD